MPSREYAHHALIGIAPPQSNPVVEAEYGALMPDGVGLLTTRLTGTAEDPKTRFRQFLENFDQSLAAYGKAQPDAMGFACTATAYLYGSDEPDILGAAFRSCLLRWQSAARWIDWVPAGLLFSVPIPIG